MAIAATPAPHAPAHRLWSGVSGMFADGAVRYGIKFGLAGMLAVFVALVIRLPEPTWALFTVFVLMIAQYVGAIAEKSVFRIIGTIVGGVLGYLLTASAEQNPVLFLLATGLIVAFTTAMFGQNRYPYAFLLCGLTIAVVTSNGLANPDQSWTFMLWRAEEVIVGILAVVLVQSLLWPRYARVEFVQNTRSAFADLRDCFAANAQTFLKSGEPLPSAVSAEGFPARITALRMLLDFGARESHYFRLRLPTYFAITTCLARIAGAIATLHETLAPNSFYRTKITEELSRIHGLLETALDDLSREESSPASRKAKREAVRAAFVALEDRIATLRDDPRIAAVPPEDAMQVGLHVLALEDITRQIERSHELLDSLPEDATQPSQEPEPFISPIPPGFWIRSGIKSGIAVTIALFLDNWLQPPGGTMLVLGAWVFTATNASSPGGQGDRRAFDYTVYNILALFVLSISLIAGTPMLSSYAVMNTVIFTWLFVWGYLSYNTHGMTIPMQMGMMGLVGVLGLNGQQPVNFQAIVGLFMGIVLAQLVASVIQRVLWPSLPQRELRDRYVEYLRLCAKIIEQGPDAIPLWQRARIATIPGEAMQRINVLTPPICPEGEQARLTAYLHSLQHIASHLVATVGKMAPLLPPEHVERGKELIHQIETEMRNHLALLEKSMQTTIPPADEVSPLAAVLDTWQHWVKDLRAWMIGQGYPVVNSVRIMGLAGRYEQSGRDMLQAAKEASQLRMSLYMGDYVL